MQCMPFWAHIFPWHIIGVLTSRTFCWKEKKTTVFIHSVIHSLLVGPSHRVGFTSIGQELWWWSKVKFLLWLKTCLPTSLNISRLHWHCALPVEMVFPLHIQKELILVQVFALVYLWMFTSISETTIHNNSSPQSFQKILVEKGDNCV